MEKIQTGVYQHYKGPRYLVIGLARHSETKEYYVIYLPLEKRDQDDKSERQRYCVRPLTGPEGFTEEVDKPEYGWKGPRFQLETPFDAGCVPD